MAKAIAVRARRSAQDTEAEPPVLSDTSLTSSAAYAEPESSARLLTSPALPPPTHRPQPDVVTMPLRPQPEPPAPAPAEPPRYTSRNWRAEAWERERERELRAIENRPDISARRRSNA